MEIEFQEFTKIPRLTRECVITEKIDGTNAQIYIAPFSEVEPGFLLARNPTQDLVMLAGSRNRWLERGKQDNYGFAEWVFQHQDELWKLGPGRHFGEWWGSKIQRGYGLTEKRFSLFNVSRWEENPPPECCSLVPVLYRGMFHTEAVEEAIERLRREGSVAVPGFMKPEGVIVFHVAGNLMFKKTLLHDESPKGVVDGN